jgi:hypothetical protein
MFQPCGDATATTHHDPGNLLFFFPSPRGAALIASLSPPSLPLAPPCLVFFRSSFVSDRTGSRSSAVRATFGPNASSKSASISSVAVAPRLRFLRGLAGEVTFDVGAGSVTPSCTGVYCVVGYVVGLFDPVMGDIAVAPLDGVACRRRHSSGLRWSSDSASPRVNNRAWGEPARRVACGSSARASFS